MSLSLLYIGSLKGRLKMQGWKCSKMLYEKQKKKIDENTLESNVYVVVFTGPMQRKKKEIT